MTAPGVVRRYVSLFRENRGLVQICVATLISMTGHGIIAPVLPLFAKGFGVSATAIGLVVGMFGMARIFFNLPAGLLSQRFGQKVMMGIGLILTGLSTWSMGTAGGLAGLIFWRFLAGTGSAMSVTAAMSFVTQISKIMTASGGTLSGIPASRYARCGLILTFRYPPAFMPTKLYSTPAMIRREPRRVDVAKRS